MHDRGQDCLTAGMTMGTTSVSMPVAKFQGCVAASAGSGAPEAIQRMLTHRVEKTRGKEPCSVAILLRQLATQDKRRRQP